MMLSFLSGIRYGALTLLTLAILSFSLINSMALADIVPPQVQEAIQKIDPKAKWDASGTEVRFSNTSRYVVAFPDDESNANLNALKVTYRLPEATTEPADIIGFSSGHFLVRLITLPNGRQSFPIVENLPLALRVARFSQDLQLPTGFLIPTVWKSLTGNLLIPDDALATNKPAEQQFPLAFIGPTSSNTQQTLHLWDPSTKALINEVSLPCQPSQLVPLQDGKTLAGLCQTQPTALVIHTDIKTVQSYTLAQPGESLVVDPTHQTLWVTHPAWTTVIPQAEAKPWRPALLTFGMPDWMQVAQKAQKADIIHSFLSVINTETDAIETLEIAHPITTLAISPYRNQLFALADNGKILYLFNTTTHQLVKTIQLGNAMSTMMMQNDKWLWFANLSTQQLQVFDLRWQEFSPLMDMPAKVNALAVDSKWLYVWLPDLNTIQRINPAKLEAGDPIKLDPEQSPIIKESRMMVHPLFPQLFLFSTTSSDVDVVNLNSGQWAGHFNLPQTTNQGFMAGSWLIPDTATSDKQVKLKFQDGRQLKLTAPLLQPATSPSKGHGQ